MEMKTTKSRYAVAVLGCCCLLLSFFCGTARAFVVPGCGSSSTRCGFGGVASGRCNSGGAAETIRGQQYHSQLQHRREQQQRQQRQSLFSPLFVSYDDFTEKLPSKSVITAVENTAPGGRVIASDVAAAAGVSLSQARKDLTALASISQGNIAVDSEGELIYTFPANLQGVLAQNSAKYKALETFRKIWPSLFWFVRVSFGVALLASLLAIFSTILFIQTSSSSSDSDDRRSGGGDDRRGGGMGFGGSYFWGPSPFDFFYYRPYGYYGYGVEGSQQRRDPDEMGFLESIFSYIFGDGNPNAKLEEKRLRLVANVIRQNDGAVTAEQLAPFCDDAPDPRAFEEESATVNVDESFVLPTVTALNGEPRVSEEGEIFYHFPELQQSAAVTSLPSSSQQREGLILRRAGLSPEASTRDVARLLQYNNIRIPRRGIVERSDLIELLENALPPMTDEEEDELDDPSLLREREIPFSLANDLNKVLAGGLGLVNLGGALYLGRLLAEYAAYGVQLPAYFGLVQSLYPFLLGYAVLFNVIPLVRSFWIKRENAKIQARNETRKNWRAALAGAVTNSRLGRKLRAVARMGSKMRRLGKDDDVVYDTSRPIEQVKAAKDQDALKDFDKLLDNAGGATEGGGGVRQLGASRGEKITYDTSAESVKVERKKDPQEEELGEFE